MEINLTTTYVGILSLIIFVLAYAVVMAEEFSHLRKSKPVIISAALIWAIIAFYFAGNKEYSYEIEAVLVKFSNKLQGMTQQEYCEQELKGKIIKCSHLKSNIKNNG